MAGLVSLVPYSLLLFINCERMKVLINKNRDKEPRDEGTDDK